MVVFDCGIGQDLCCTVTMPKMWHINNATFDIQEISCRIVKYGHVVHESQPQLTMVKLKLIIANQSQP